MNDKKAALALLPLLVLLIPIEIATQGYILSWLWEWYVVPLGVSQINVAHALGLTLIYNMISFGQRKTEAKSKDNFEIAGNIIGKFIGYGIALLLGYFLSGYV